MNTNLKKYGTSFLLGGGLFCLYLFTREFPASEASENFRMLADAATIPGLLFVMFGALIWAASLGAMDGVSYGLGYALRAFLPGGRMQPEETYAEHIAKRREKYANSRGYGFLFITGIIFLAIAGIFIALFYLF
ncbi:MAG: DUF3899 domain-containing protein [Lachnospiraceae bacterium]|jgi:hypothetical protein|nr:DUF3899 domain-containing protein [Lachnospiraceae bacterium]